MNNKEGLSPPFYRRLGSPPDLVSFRVKEGESDLNLLARRDLSRPARAALRSYRRQLESYLDRHPEFKASLLPIGVKSAAPPMVRAMASAAARCGVGPMAAVAGALAYFVARDLLPFSRELIVENGGDIFLRSKKERIVAVFAGRHHPLTGKLGILIKPQDSPLGVATSSGTIGPSLSWGKADAAVVLARDPLLADAAATALANRLYSSDDAVWDRAMDFLLEVEGVRGGLIILEEKVLVRGKIELIGVSEMEFL